jgi:CubicO group peptidase (beta-lactamase class C family)
MRVTSREQLDSRSEFFRRCRLVAISMVSALAIAACGGGGGGGGGGDNGGGDSGGGGGGGGGTGGGGTTNVAPTVQAGADQTIQLPTNSVDLSGSATDDSTTSTLTYSWSATSGPSGVTFSAANAAATTVTFPGAGDYVLTLSVSDGSLTGTDSVAVTVSPAAAEESVYPTTDINNDSPDHGWARVAAASEVGMDQALLDQAATYASTAGSVVADNNAGMIVRHGRIVRSWGNIDQRYDMKSTSKSIGGIALGLAYDDGLIDLNAPAQTYLPTIGDRPASNAATGWLGQITVKQLATHTAGFVKLAQYTFADPPDTDPANDADPTLVSEPGTVWRYSDGGLNWLAETLTARYNQDLADVLSTEVWGVLGLNSTKDSALVSSDVFWRTNATRPAAAATTPPNRELASGIFANANAMARVGLLFLRNGVWANDQRILSQEFVDMVKTPPTENAALTIDNPTDFPAATTNYGMLWWTNATGQLPNVPRDAYWGWGLGDSLIVVIPSLDIVAVRAGFQPDHDAAATPGERVWNDTDWNGDYSVLAPFLDPIVQSVTQ